MTNKQLNNRSLANIAGIVALATLVSKVFGLFREVAIAAVFGIGPVVNAYRYAYVLPGFLLILLGGINGPFHSSLVSVLAKRDRSESAKIVETVSTIVSIFLLIATFLLILFADKYIDLAAHGLDSQSRRIAIEQLKIMAPLAVLAGLIGIGFGTLNAANLYWLPSVSPLFSSLITLIGLGVFAFVVGKQVHSAHYLELGGIILATTTLAGGILQWLVQVFAQWKHGLGTLKFRLNWRTPGVSDVLRVMIPATLSSGMLLINTSTDMYFAAPIEGAAAAMSYSNFLILTPLGIISNMILVPLFPVFSRLSDRENWPQLKIKIKEGIFLSALTMLPLTAIFVSLALPLVQVIYQRGAFNRAASDVVVPVVMAYGVGMFFYLGRDVLLRVFYALGDGSIPARISIINILLNFGADFFLVGPFKTPGLILATVTVNIISMVAFLWILNRRLEGLPIAQWSAIIFKLFAITFISTLVGWGFDHAWREIFTSHNHLLRLLELILGVVIVLACFAGLAWQLKLPELEIVVSKFQQKLLKRKS